MAKEFLTLKRQTVVDIANAIRSKTNSDKAIKIEDLDDAIGKIESGGGSGGGSVIIEKSDSAPVPNTGYVEKIKFNTDLSKEEVYSVLEKLEYDEHNVYTILMEADLYGEGAGYNYNFYVERYYNDDGLLDYAIYGWNYVPNTDNCLFDDCLFSTSYENSIDIDGNQWNSCWSPDWKEEYGEINCEVTASYPDQDDPTIIREIGLQNDLLVDLVCVPGLSIPGEKTEVPREGYVDKVFIDTSLSVEEVVNILEKLEYDDSGTAYVFTNNDNSIDSDDICGIIIGAFDGAYMIGNLADLSTLLFDSANGGWNPDFNGEIQVNSELVVEGIGPSGYYVTFGTQNDLLVDLIYMRGTLDSKELTGTYKAINLSVTKNGTIDILKNIDEQKFPVSVNVNVEGGATLETYNDGNVKLTGTYQEVDSVTVTKNETRFYLVDDLINNKQIPGMLSVNVNRVLNDISEERTKSLSHLFGRSNSINDNLAAGNVRDYMTKIDTSYVQYMDGMFKNCTSLTSVDVFDTSNAVDMSYMFYNCVKLKTMPALNTSKVTNMSHMFYNCDKMNSFASLDTSKVTDTSFMFAGCSNYLTSMTMDLPAVTNIESMFESCSSLSYVYLTFGRNVTIRTASRLFKGCRKLETVIFNRCTNQVKDMSYMFYDNASLKSYSGYSFDTKHVYNFTGMFHGCTAITSITSINMEGANFDDWNVRSSQTEYMGANNMFYGCRSLQTLGLTNIKIDLQIGSDLNNNPWGHLLTVDSLINTCKECVKCNSHRILAVGATNMGKLADVYVKFTDTTITEIAIGAKGTIEVCESTDEGAMLIKDYMTMKNWHLTEELNIPVPTVYDGSVTTTGVEGDE